MNGDTRVVVVDATAGRRARLVRALEADGDVTVVGQCESGDAALDAIRVLRPDVVILTGAARHPATAAVEAIMAFVPTPILVVHPPADDGPDAVRDDLAAGAVGHLSWSPEAGPAADDRLRRKIRVLRGVTVVRHPRGRLRPHGPNGAPSPPRRGGTRPVIGMAASTGGPHTLARVIGGLVAIEAPVLIVQHIHPDFVDGFVDWVARTTGATVTIAVEGAVPEPGVFHIAPAGVHLKVTASGRLTLDRAPVTLHMPSANELFLSMARSLGPSAVGVLLTGMGDDGAAGLLAIRRAGGTTIVQDGESSAIDGMPRAARELGAAGLVAPLPDIARAVLTAAGR
ncbi:MAG: two-component system, chemotaxis family, protein-glutamate methylesterase/glutaminase [Actinomycetota bacterium]|nr:two-component system, chemotaxis family, protein-glutamate methylesterase/glutaminase [Actinomycetota bacterium]